MKQLLECRHTDEGGKNYDKDKQDCWPGSDGLKG